MINTEQRLTALEKLLFETDQYRNNGGELPYKVYTALLTIDVGVSASVIELQNTIGTITLTSGTNYTRDVAFNCTGCFTADKTFSCVQLNTDAESPNSTLFSIYRVNADQIKFVYYRPIDDVDGILDTPNIPIEIRIYP